jgi:alginate O-acetyltransferase complex protein AlgI
MIFTTYWFLIFAVITTAVYWLLPKPILRWPWLGAACLVFHAHFAGPAGMAPIIVLIVITYLAGLSRNRAACLAAIIVCVATLCFYKYALFLIGAAVQPLSESWASVLSAKTKSVMPGLPPLGISFFVFEFFHYLYDVKKGAEPIRNPLKFLLFAIFFPSLVAGPIKRYPQFLASLEEGSRRISAQNFAEGLMRIALGYAKKVIIADNLTFTLAQHEAGFAALGLLGRWLFVVGLAFRILMDFSGYSDIAIGFARLLGVRLPENFNWPYLARSIQDFWQRWHISLSSWIRDYVYIPLGGNQHGTARRLINGLLAFGLCGLWHGPAWHFVEWGLYHGVGLGICASYGKLPGLGPVLEKVFNKEPLSGWFLTQLYVSVGWLLFFYPAAQAWKMAGLLFGL